MEKVCIDILGEYIQAITHVLTEPTSFKKVYLSPANKGLRVCQSISGVYKGEGPFDVFVNLRNIPLLAVTEVRVECECGVNLWQ